MQMTAKVFVDTNILLRATVFEFPDYARIKPVVDQRIADGDELWINGQVIREYFNQVTRPQSFMQPITSDQVARQYKKLRAVFKIAVETDAVIEQFVTLLQTHPKGGKQVHDTNLIATMLVYQIPTLMTLNLDDMKRFSDLVTVLSP